MIDSIINFSIRNKLAVFLLIAILIGCGIYSIKNLAVDAVPDITNNQVQVITNAPSLAAQEIEQFITYPLELSFANLPGLIEVRSVSRLGISVITLVFEDDMEVLSARQLVNEKINEVSPNLPDNMDKPQLAPISTGLGEIYQYVIYPEETYKSKYSATDLRTIQDWMVKRMLAGIPGVVEISSFGGKQKQYEINVNPHVLKSYKLSISEVFNALSLNNQNTGGGYIEKGPFAYFIRSEGLIRNIEDIENVVVAFRNNLPIAIKDIGSVKEGHALRYGALTHNGEGEVAGGIVMMLKGANSAEVIEGVKKRIEEIRKSLPEGIVLEAYLDRSELISRTISTVITNLVEGGLIVIFILVLLLGNLRAGLIVASVIPLSMLFALSMMQLFGISANLMSLGAIDFGLIVDGSIIVVEAILLRINSGFAGKDLNKKQFENIVYGAATGIRRSAAFGEIIILIVYLPILALSGIEGKMFKPMAQTVVFAIAGALILSLTYVPMMSALIFKRKVKHGPDYSEKIIDKIYVPYSRFLQKALNNGKTSLAAAITLFMCSILVLFQLGGDFMPRLEEGDFAVETRLAPGTSLSETIAVSTKAEKILLTFPEVKKVVSKIGTAEIATDPMPMEANDLMVILKDKKEWRTASTSDELAEKMKEALSVLPGVEFEFQQPIEMRFNELMTGIKSDIAIKIFGEDTEVLYSKANEIATMVAGVEGVSDLKVEQIAGHPQVLVKFNRRKMAQYGLNINDVNNIIHTAYAGGNAGVVVQGEKRFDLVVRMTHEQRNDLANLHNLFIDLPSGEKIPLSTVADITMEDAPLQISRESTKRRTYVGISVRNRDLESVVMEIKDILKDKLKLPAGYYLSYGGEFENLQTAKERLYLAVPIALILIFFLLYVTFGSIKETLIIFTAIPFSAIGGILFLWLRDMPFSISAGIGFIALFGVAVLNGIVLMSSFNKLKLEGVSDAFSRIIEGTRIRFRPVLITALVASLGFLPMALSNSAGAEVQKPLATVVIGGLITATILTLIILPVLYLMFSKRKETNE